MEQTDNGPFLKSAAEQSCPKGAFAVDLDEFQARFDRRYIIKKRINAVLCLFIALCGTSSVLYSVFVNGKNLIDRLRYMTFNATIFTTLICLVFAIACLVEAAEGTEITRRWIYFLRLSSAATEVVVFAVVMFGLTPLVEDLPDVTSYTGVMMHLVVPFATVVSFVFNDAPIGRLRPLEPLHGTWFITCYAVVMLFLFGTGILPSSAAPYTFLDFEHSSLRFILLCALGVYFVGYVISWLLSELNRKLSWIWFYDLTGAKRKRDDR